jgi:uncharacterized protein YndB with AHSA1/START domain
LCSSQQQQGGIPNAAGYFTQSRNQIVAQNDVYKALTTIEGLSGWWTTNTQGENKVGGVIQFRFGASGFDMKILELHPAKSALWQVVDGPKEWIGTKVSWEFKQEGGYTIILFKHQG